MKIFGRGKDVIYRDTSPVATNPNLSGIVTSDMQKRFIGSHSCANKVTLLDIIRDPELLAKFDRNEFPKVEIMEDGRMFFQPICRVVSPIHTHFVKWFSLTEDLNFSHDHSYEFAQIDPNGYLMKIILSMQPDRISGFEVRYVTKVNDVEFVSTVEARTEGAYVTDAVNAAIPVEKFVVTQFVPGQYMKVQSVIQDSESFIETYLKDVQEL